MKYTALALAIALTASAANASYKLDAGPEASPVGGSHIDVFSGAHEDDIHGDQISGDEMDRGGENDHENDMNTNFGW